MTLQTKVIGTGVFMAEDDTIWVRTQTGYLTMFNRGEIHPHGEHFHAPLSVLTADGTLIAGDLVLEVKHI